MPSKSPTDPFIAKNESSRPRFPSRRELLAAAGAVATASVAPTPVRATTYPSRPSDVPPTVEGFFFVVYGTDADADRIFFLKSSWLPFFELTDLYYNSAYSQKQKGKNDMVYKIKHHGKKKQWDVLYTEDINPQFILANASASDVIDVLDPLGRTYLACSLSPNLT
jgi:hypothetical protein